ncbi:Hypothetical protein F387_00477 [Wohlfahrtiimonas chitiniclastica SH04]|uniref:Uncharacterized protein n=1 Tax=Wohlfahrtiimonas chitiniclastica SH04 TaxID=1261130 RepID=L8XZI0_9GAMM|nr:Hypothetical protein F387_00477 [Wohlfahrtiimonas chitiniclastica SH04]KZX37489.1 hypothetical protein A6V30_00965 [Wohlfahrtiimonas chitiniclastica]OYQ74137.1 hypothetical protein B9T18_08475 [Wohlfahrtiimonas chitiniclastica]OYQ88110.1 hypothetical protein B9T10_08635 [Wohlfahrtiimonas chitiniclastica]
MHSFIPLRNSFSARRKWKKIHYLLNSYLLTLVGHKSDYQGNPIDTVLYKNCIHNKEMLDGILQKVSGTHHLGGLK